MKSESRNLVNEVSEETRRHLGVRMQSDREMNIMLSKTAQLDSIVSELTIRPTSMDDLDKAVALFDMCAMHMIGQPETTRDAIENEWRLEQFNLERSTRIVLTPDGEAVGYVEVWDNEAVPANIWVWGRVHPDFENLGIGTRLMCWAESRAREALPRVPDGIRVAMRSGTFNHHLPGKELFLSLEMTPIRHFWTMAIDMNGKPPEATVPEGIHIRHMSDADDPKTVYSAIEDAFRDHWGHVDRPFEEEFHRWKHFMLRPEVFDPTLWFLAMDDGEIAGISLCRWEESGFPGRGWVSTLGVRRQWRRQGLGLALLHHSFNEFYARGKRSVGLGVDAASLTGATRLYEKAGMSPIRQFDMYEKVLRPGRDIAVRSRSDIES